MSGAAPTIREQAQAFLLAASDLPVAERHDRANHLLHMMRRGDRRRSCAALRPLVRAVRDAASMERAGR